MSQNFCPHCGAPISSPNAHFCGNCGKALPAGMNVISPVKPEETKVSPKEIHTAAKGTKAPADAVKEEVPATVEKQEVPVKSETQPAIPSTPEKTSSFPDIAPEGAEEQTPAPMQTPAPVIKEHTGPLPQPEIPYTPAFKHNKDDGFSDPSFRGMYFSFHGRLNRKRYFWRSVAIGGLTLAGIVGAVIFFGIVEAMGDGVEFLMIPVVLGLVVLWMGSLISGVSLQIRRMQDLGWAPGAVYGYVAATIAWVFIELFIEPLLSAGAEADLFGVWGILRGGRSAVLSDCRPDPLVQERHRRPQCLRSGPTGENRKK